jgi:hypothetical protein
MSDVNEDDDPTGPDPPGGGEAAATPGRTRRRWWMALVLGLVVIAGGIGAGVLVADRSGSDRGATTGAALADALPDPDSGSPTAGSSTPEAPDPDTDASTPETPPPTGGCPNRPPGSSPAIFDASSGTYAAHIVAFDRGALTLDFDVVQWLSGEDANEAYRRDNPGDPTGTPPNDHHLVNETPLVRTAPLRPDAAILLSPSLQVGDATVSAATVDDLASFLATSGPAEVGTVFWLTFGAGEVTDVCFQFRP